MDAKKALADGEMAIYKSESRGTDMKGAADMSTSQLQRGRGADIGGARAMRSFLVVVRAGDQSLHKSWMKKGEPRQWDLLVDYYGQTPDYHDEFADFTTSGGVAKFPSLGAIDAANPGFLGAYQAV